MMATHGIKLTEKEAAKYIDQHYKDKMAELIKEEMPHPKEWWRS